MANKLDSFPRARDLLLVALLVVSFFGAGLGARDLWNPNEGTYGRALVEMVESDEWLVPTLNGERFAEKPILYYWAARLVVGTLGEVSELALRIPPLVVGVASAIFVYLLVGAYVGRRRAWIAVVVFSTMYQVWWTSRAVQMDSFVLLSTLVTVYAVSGGLDRGWSPGRAWVIAGVATGLGVCGKGPVAIVLAAIVVAGYLGISRRWPRELLKPGTLALGGLAFLATAAPWFLLLAARGESEALHEVLVRQNFSRFVEAWDHEQPWWYFLEYLWLDYAPWSLLLPIAAFVRPASTRELSLHRLSWVWIGGVVLFFSLADSKRAPYILPIAPAIAALASSVVDRMIDGRLSRGQRIGAQTAHGLVGSLLLAGGLFLLFVPLDERVPPTVAPAAVGALMVVLGALVLLAVLWQRRPELAPASLAVAMITLLLVASLHILPALNEIKSHRGFAEEVAARLAPERPLAGHFGIYKWVRGGYPFYLGRPVPHLDNPEAIERYWAEVPSPCLLLENPELGQIRPLLRDAEEVLEGRIGSRTAYVFCRSTD